MTGLHISILGMGLFQLLKHIGFGNTGAGLLALAVMLQYGMLTGGSVSAMRAVCMFLLSVGAKILGRSYDLLTALSVSAMLLLLDSPAYLYSSSFLLSFGAVTGLGAVSPFLMEIAPVKRKLAKSFLSSFSVQLATLPVMLVFFGEVSLAGIFLNLIVLPTVSVVLISGLCGGILGLVSMEAAVAAAVPGRAFLFFYEKLCVLAGKLPFCTWTGGQPRLWQSIVYYACLAGGIAAAVWLIRREKKRTGKGAEGLSGRRIPGRHILGGRIFGRRIPGRHVPGRVVAALAFSAALCLGILTLAFQDRGELRITCLDVGQGDGIVLEIPGGGAFLMDFGSSSRKNTGQYQLLPYLKSRGITYLDGILVSHTDTDHISGIQELLELMTKDLTSIKAGILILPDWNPEEKASGGHVRESPEASGADPSGETDGEGVEKAYGGLLELADKAGVRCVFAEQGDRLVSGQAEMKFLAPEKTASGADVNEEGMVMELKYGSFRALFTGDIGEATEKSLLKKGVLSDVDFLKTAHHGSRYSTCREFLDKVRPELAVISCSDSNNYGHPSPETVERLEGCGARIFYTMKSGAVTVRTDGERIRAEGFLSENKSFQTV